MSGGICQLAVVGRISAAGSDTDRVYILGVGGYTPPSLVGQMTETTRVWRDLTGSSPAFEP